MKIALTGAATGIGAATAKALQLQGARITGFDIVEADAVSDFIRVDLGDLAQIENSVRKASKEGPYDALINCAGLPPRDGLAARILAVNFFGLRAFT